MESNGKVNILITDDEPANLLVLETILEGLGENLVKARSGEETLKHLLRDEFAVVVLDVRMPGIDGFETARLMRQRKRTEHTPIIFLTAAYQSDEHMIRGYSMGAVDYLNKPVATEILKAKVATFVELHRKNMEVRSQAEQLREMERRDYQRNLAEARQQWEAQRIQDQLAIAADIQQKLFPTGAPCCSNFDIYGTSHPADTTGGDYFDFITMQDGSTAFVIGDVSGHGFGPSLLMATTRAYLRALLLTHTDVGQVLTLANKALAADVSQGRFVTLFLGRLDSGSGVVEYSSAGHQPGYILSADGSIKAKLESTAVPLGIGDDIDFPLGERFTMSSGDLLFLHTDGVVETVSEAGVAFGEEQALTIVRDNRHKSAAEIVNALYQAVYDFAPEGKHGDDITSVVIKMGSNS